MAPAQVHHARPWLRWGLAVLLAALLVLDRALPPPLPAPDAGTVVLAADGTPLRTWPGRDGVWRHPVTPAEVSPLYLQALLSYEDRWFRWHPGVNPVALARAGWQWWRSGHIVSGGSTLTMQVARLVDPPAGGSRSLGAKLRQIARALQLEARLSKDEILALYLSHAPMGGIVEGVEMASRIYLGKSARHLSHAEAALLAALPQAPSRLRPDRHPRAAEAARDKVLQRLAARGIWHAQQVGDARMERVAAAPIRAHWIAPLAAQRLRDARGRDAGTVLHSTLDVELQSSVERMLLDRVGSLPPQVSMAVLVMHNDSLAVQAYAGSADFSDDTRAAHVDMVRGVRSPGSTLKPFLYALALDEGLVHGESLLVDAPQDFGGYRPGNFQADFTGPVSLSEALQRSLNVPAVDLLERLGPAHFASVLRAGGLRLRLPGGAEPNLSLILGGAGTTLEELVGAYRALARDGSSGRPRLWPDAPRVEARLMSAGAAYIVRDILEAGGHPERPWVEARAGLAWKTGTSFGFRDAWAVGVTDTHTLGVWVGRPDGTPNPGHFGASIAAPLLHDIAAVLPGSPRASRPRPDSVQAVTTCWPLGLRADATPSGHCQVRRTGWALHGTVPPTLPDRGRDEGLLVRGPCGELARWPVALVPWMAEEASATSCHGRASVQGTALRIAGLDDGATLHPVPGESSVSVVLDTRGVVASGEPVLWLLDGHPVREARGPVTLTLQRNGRHRVTVLDAHGRHAWVEVTVAGL